MGVLKTLKFDEKFLLASRILEKTEIVIKSTENNKHMYLRNRLVFLNLKIVLHDNCCPQE